MTAADARSHKNSAVARRRAAFTERRVGGRTKVLPNEEGALGRQVEGAGDEDGHLVAGDGEGGAVSDGVAAMDNVVAVHPADAI